MSVEISMQVGLELIKQLELESVFVVRLFKRRTHLEVWKVVQQLLDSADVIIMCMCDCVMIETIEDFHSLSI